MKNEREPGIHLTPKQERIDAIASILVPGDDVPSVNGDATELQVYNGPRNKRRRYVWNEETKRWAMK